MANLEAERAVIGTVLEEGANGKRSRAVLAEVLSVLSPGEFSHSGHTAIVEAMAAVSEQRDAAVIDPLTVQQQMLRAGTLSTLSELGGEGYLLTTLPRLGRPESPDELGKWINSVKDASKRRRMLVDLDVAKDRIRDPGEDLDELLGSLADGAGKLAKEGGHRHWLTDRFKTVGELELLKKPAPKRKYLLTIAGKGFLPAGRVGMLAAEGGAGKSWAMIQLAVAVATGTQWLRAFSVDPSQRGKVLLLLAEEEQDEFHARLEETCRDLPPGHVDDVNKNVVPLTLAGEDTQLIRSREEIANGQVAETQFFRQLKRTIESRGPWSLIVFDPLTRFAADDTEDSNAGAARMIRTFERFSHVAGKPTVLFTHHTTKTSRQSNARNAVAARGASALTDNSRYVATMEPRERYEPIEWEGQNTPVPRLVDLRLVKSNYGWIADMTTLTSDAERHGYLRLCEARELLIWKRAAGENQQNSESNAAGSDKAQAEGTQKPPQRPLITR